MPPTPECCAYGRFPSPAGFLRFAPDGIRGFGRNDGWGWEGRALYSQNVPCEGNIGNKSGMSRIKSREPDDGLPFPFGIGPPGAARTAGAGMAAGAADPSPRGRLRAGRSPSTGSGPALSEVEGAVPRYAPDKSGAPRDEEGFVEQAAIQTPSSRVGPAGAVSRDAPYRARALRRLECGIPGRCSLRKPPLNPARARILNEPVEGSRPAPRFHKNFLPPNRAT